MPTEPPPGIYGSCSDTYENPLEDCGPERSAALSAVGHLGYYPLSVEIHPGGFPCGEPFEDRQPAETCRDRTPGTVVAYVLFVGTDKVAALTLDKGADGYTATVVSFQEPPSVVRPLPVVAARARQQPDGEALGRLTRTIRPARSCSA